MSMRLYGKPKVLDIVRAYFVSAGGTVSSSGELRVSLPNSRDGDGQYDEYSVECISILDETSPTHAEEKTISGNEQLTYKTSRKDFDIRTYFQNLHTSNLGLAVLHARSLPSTVHVVDRLAPHVGEDTGLVVVADQQTSGKGRSCNVWESPLGCAMFSFPLVVPLSSKLGRSLSFVQHLVATAVVLAVRLTPGYEDLDVRIKWPNDILTSDKIKLGGILVSSSIFRQEARCNVGVGMNIDNLQPTSSLNQQIANHNAKHSTSLQTFSIEQFIARTMTELEKLLKIFAVQGPDGVLPLYLNYWLHLNEHIKVRPEGINDSIVQDIPAQITGLDEHGFLQVKLQSGEVWSVQSNGNRFDMMSNLLLLKKH